MKALVNGQVLNSFKSKKGGYVIDLYDVDSKKLYKLYSKTNSVEGAGLFELDIKQFGSDNFLIADIKESELDFSEV